MIEILKQLILLVALIGVVAFFVSLFMEEKSRCEARGGALVRGAILFACVKGVGP